VALATGWKEIDKNGWRRDGRPGKPMVQHLLNRQPEHVEIAAALGRAPGKSS
jgi:hypothetical protein